MIASVQQGIEGRVSDLAEISTNRRVLERGVRIKWSEVAAVAVDGARVDILLEEVNVNGVRGWIKERRGRLLKGEVVVVFVVVVYVLCSSFLCAHGS